MTLRRSPRRRLTPGFRSWAWLFVCVAMLLLTRGVSADEDDSAPIIIGSKNFTESRLLAEIMAQLIEGRADARVQRRQNLGGTQVVFSALTHGQIDVYPEYTGTAWTILLEHDERVGGSLQAYLSTNAQLQARFGVQWGMPFGFENSYALAVRREQADELGLATISDLIAHEDTLTAGVSHEFLERADGYPGLQAHYGLDLAKVRGMEHGLAYEAIDAARIDITDTYTTDGKLPRFDVVLLTDDREFFPPYDAAPLMRTDLDKRHPRAVAALRELAFAIDDEKMRQLNFEVEVNGRSAKQVAAAFLADEGLLGGVATTGSTAVTDPRGLLGRMWQSRAMLVDRGIEHIWLTVIAVLSATIFAVPVGIVLTRVQWLRPWVLGATGVIQTVPSLALLAFMIPVPGLGLGARSAVVALFLYALLPIVRNTYAGITEVDATLIDAARGMGLTDRQILRRIQLPLATRTIMAGVRTSTVISIGVATLAAFIGAGGLGDPIITGLQLNDTTLILLGALPAAALALVADFLLGRIEAMLSPAGL